jgi:anaerobic magnesium-protoporphyrin IX monomethyl ester cyclase
MLNPKKKPKILIITTPIRPVPTEFPPLGSLSVISALNKAGFNDTELYNIDLLRPNYKDVISHIETSNPDILGISAVVSTAYEYSKRLSQDIKKLLPQTTIVLGGNLGASAEIILKKTGVDFICTGEGEASMVEFVKRWMTAQAKDDYESIKGWSFLNDDEELIVTPYVDPIPAEDIYDIDWSILEDMDQMEYFITPYERAIEDHAANHDPRCFEPHRRGKTLVRIPTTKGCVARCTFCHRWDKGIRFIPVPLVMERIDFFVQKYNLGFIRVADENFGSNKKWLLEFIEEIKKRDLLWSVGGMRVSTITSEMIGKMKEAGCTSIFYGMETGSAKMLEVMEKVTTVEQNKNTVKWMAEHDIFTIVQLILGMPGETPETVQETIEFINYFVEQSPKTDPNALSINFAQALPGTPLYEIARGEGIIGQTLDEEEEYLIKISDRDARDGETTINFTDCPKIYLEKWRFDISNSARKFYIDKWGEKNYNNIILNSQPFKEFQNPKNGEKKTDSGYFAEPARGQESSLGLLEKKEIEFGSSTVANTIHDIDEQIEIKNNKIPSLFSLMRKKSISSIATFYPRLFWFTRRFTIVYIFLNECRKSGISYSLKLVLSALTWKLNQIKSVFKQSDSQQGLSLRKVLRKGSLSVIDTDNPAMEKLRLGR